MATFDVITVSVFRPFSRVWYTSVTPMSE